MYLLAKRMLLYGQKDNKMVKSENIEWATDDKFKNIWIGQEGLIIGRGAGQDYARKKALDAFDGKVIGCNTAFNARFCDAIVLMDEKVFLNNKEAYRKLANQGSYIFVVNPIYPLYGVKIIGLEARKPERCSNSFDTGFYPCRLTGYVAVNIAILTGLNPIYLYGFTPSKAEDKKVAERSFDFDPIADYCYKNGVKIYTVNRDPIMELYFEYKSLNKRKV